ncbi:MAG: GNAT family N-acetyltransferase [Raineya sp.]|jgi:ribosomal-protein-alanine N-acetyltransferase|nr:GNAT family N-acetyltransferase [Raineya sp.]
MVLETKRIILEPVSFDRINTFYDIVTNPFVRKYLFDNNELEKDTVNEFVKISNQLFQNKNYGLWFIILKENQELIGFTGLWHFFEESQPQLLYALLPNYTKSGYAKEATQKVIEYALKNLKFDFLDASCDTSNLSSLHTATSIGMVKIKEEVIDNKPLTFFRVYNE